MITLTKSLLKGSVVAKSSMGDVVELTGEQIIGVMVRYGATLKEATTAIDALLSGTVNEVTIGSEDKNA